MYWLSIYHPLHHTLLRRVHQRLIAGNYSGLRVAAGGSSIYVVARFLQPAAARLFSWWQGFCSLWRLVYLCCGKVFAACGGSSIYVVARFLQPVAARLFMLWQVFCSQRRLVYLCCGKVFAATGCKNLATTKNVCELPQAASSQ